MAKQSKVVVADTEAELDAATLATERSSGAAAAAAGNTTTQPKVPPTEIRDLPLNGEPLQVQKLDGTDPVVSTGDGPKSLNELRRDVYEKQRGGSPPPFPGANTTRYESRIRIAEAWQYNGQLATAPGWVDRSWAAWGDADSLRGLEQGPALRVPTVGQVAEKVARVGDYVVRQEVTIALGVEPDIQIEVWEKENFEKFFLPSHPEVLKPKAEKDEDAA